jgi:hypothetical protein
MTDHLDTSSSLRAQRSNPGIVGLYVLLDRVVAPLLAMTPLAPGQGETR